MNLSNGHYIRLKTVPPSEFWAQQRLAGDTAVFDAELPIFSGLSRAWDDMPMCSTGKLSFPMDGMQSEAFGKADGMPLHAMEFLDQSSGRRGVWSELNPVLLADKLSEKQGSGAPRPFTLSRSMGTASSPRGTMPLDDAVRGAVATAAAEKYMVSASKKNPARGMYSKSQIEAASGAISGAMKDYFEDRDGDKLGRTGLSQLGLKLKDGPIPALYVSGPGRLSDAMKDGSFDEFRKGLSEKISERADALGDRKATALAKTISVSVNPGREGCYIGMDARYSCTGFDLCRMDRAIRGADEPSAVYGTEVLSNAAKMASYGCRPESRGYENLIHTLTKNGDWHIADRSDFPAELDRDSIVAATDVPEAGDLDAVNDAAAKMVGNFARRHGSLLKGTGLSVDEDGYLSMSDEATAKTPAGYAAIRKFGMAANDFMKAHPLTVYDVALEEGGKRVSGDYAPFLGDLKFDRAGGSLEARNIYVGYGDGGFGVASPQAEAEAAKSDDDGRRPGSGGGPAAPAPSAYERLRRMCEERGAEKAPEAPEAPYPGMQY